MDNVEVIVCDSSITEADQHAVFQLTVELDKRWNLRDAGAFADLFEEDADFRFYSEACSKENLRLKPFGKGRSFRGCQTASGMSSLLRGYALSLRISPLVMAPCVL